MRRRTIQISETTAKGAFAAQTSVRSVSAQHQNKGRQVLANTFTLITVKALVTHR